MMSCAESAYQTVRDGLIETRFLRPHLLTKTLYSARPANLEPLSTRLRTTIETDLANYSNSAQLLVCGFSRNGRQMTPHIFSVDDPGRASNHDDEGFGAIGIGYVQALGRLLAEDYNRNKWKLDEAIYNTFDAKAHAEIVQGVGIDWDGEIILGSMSKRIPISIASAIGQWFDEITKSPFSREKAVHRRRLRRWRAQLSRFSKKALLESQS